MRTTFASILTSFLGSVSHIYFGICFLIVVSIIPFLYHVSPIGERVVCCLGRERSYIVC